MCRRVWGSVDYGILKLFVTIHIALCCHFVSFYSDVLLKETTMNLLAITLGVFLIHVLRFSSTSMAAPFQVTNVCGNLGLHLLRKPLWTQTALLFILWADEQGDNEKQKSSKQRAEVAKQWWMRPVREYFQSRKVFQYIALISHKSRKWTSERNDMEIW